MPTAPALRPSSRLTRHAAALAAVATLSILVPCRVEAQGTVRERLRERAASRAPGQGAGGDRHGAPARGGRRGGAAAIPTPALADAPYGPDTLQRFDVYLPPAGAPAPAGGRPVIVYVHGGGWRRGDKSMPQMVGNKAPCFTGLGAVFVSVNYRVLPTDVLEQARDVARAVAVVQRRASEWQANPARVSLMGHSAGAHLVALVTADPTLLRDAGARPVIGTVALDQGALDVPASMTRKHFKLYDDAFGQDPAFWTRVSPLHQLRRAGHLAAPVMAACSSERLDPCPQAREFAAAARTLRGRVEVLPLALTHQAINDQLGLPGAYTDAVTTFLRSVGGVP